MQGLMPRDFRWEFIIILMEWQLRAFGFVTEINENFQIVNANSYSAVTNSHIIQFLRYVLRFIGLLCLYQCPLFPFSHSQLTS
jgi:hypothetical protein